MDKERLVDIIRTAEFTQAHLEELDGLVKKYPWFGLPRFLRLKVHGQLDKTPESTELSRAVIFSSDREHLYKWVNGTFDSMIETTVPGSTELEFLDSSGDEAGDEEPFFLLDDADEDSGNNVDEDSGNDADAKPIPEKDETEMEEPEIEEPEAVPVIDTLDDEEEENEADVPPDDTPLADHAAAVGNAADAPLADHAAAVGNATDAAENDGPGEPVRSGDTVGANSTDSILPDPSTNSSNTATTNRSANLIERFLESEPGAIKADKQTNLEGDVSEGSVQEDDSFITDTLAKIYVKQGLHAKAIYAYERLSLKYPEKSAYFAAQIEKIKNNANV